MQPVNGFFLYLLGSIASLFAMADGVRLVTYQPPILNAVVLLDNFKSNEQNRRNLPDSIRRADELWNLLGALLEVMRHHPNRVLEPDLRMAIAHSLNSFQTALEQDLQRVHTFILEEKRSYPAAILISDIEKIIPPKTLPYLSHFTMANLREAGAALAFDHFTSTGFHTMRAVEDTARRYYELVAGAPAVRQYPNGDRSYTTLGQISYKLATEMLPKLTANRTPTGKLGLVVPTLGALCVIYRNPLSHPEIVTLDEDEAIDVFNKGIDVISTMVQDAITGGRHFCVPLSTIPASWKAKA